MPTSIVNGFEPIHQPWYSRWFGSRTPAVARPQADATVTEEPKEPEKTGPQASAGAAWGCGWGEALRGTPATYRQMRRWATLEMQRGNVLNKIEAGSWTVEADDDAPAGAKELIEKTVLPHRAAIVEHAAASSLDYGNACFEVVPAVTDGRTVMAYPKPLRPGGDGTTIWTTPGGKFLGLSTSTDRRTDQPQGPTITGGECLLFTYDGEPGDLHGRSRMENAREYASKYMEVQNKIGMLINKESGSVTKVSHPPEDQVPGAAQTAATFAQNIASGSAWIAVNNALAALTPAQRKSATVDQIIALLATDFWGVESLDGNGNGAAIAACQAYAEYLDVQAARAYHQPERGTMEGQHGTKSEAVDHADTGTLDCESWERKLVQRCLNPQHVDWVLVENWGPAARGKVRIVANPLRDVQEQIDTMLIQNVSTNTATADEFYRTFDFDAVAQRRGISKRKVPLPPPEPKPAPAVNGKGRGMPVDGGTPRLAASRDMNDDRLDALFSRIVDGRPVLAASRDGDEGGHWVTIEGEHVFIRGGVIAKGPANLVGKSLDHLSKADAEHHFPVGTTARLKMYGETHTFKVAGHHEMADGIAEPMFKPTKQSEYGSPEDSQYYSAAGLATLAEGHESRTGKRTVVAIRKPQEPSTGHGVAHLDAVSNTDQLEKHYAGHDPIIRTHRENLNEGYDVILPKAKRIHRYRHGNYRGGIFGFIGEGYHDEHS
jgi:hypothetical protein